MVNVEYIAQNVAEYIFVKLSKHLDMDVGYQRRIMEKAVARACGLCRVCKGITRKGGRCSRHVAGDAEYCFQHRGVTMASDNPRHRSSAEKESSEEESSGSEEESSEDESSASDEESSEDESSASDEDSSEEDTEDESSASDEEDSEEEPEEESSGESSDEEVPPPKKHKKAKKPKKSKKYRTTVEEEPSPALPLQQKGTPLVREFVGDKDRLACAFLEAVRDVSREAAREVAREASSNPDIPKDEDVIYRWLTVEAITAIRQINNTGVIMYDTVDRISTDLSKGRYERIDLNRLAEQISHNLGMDA